MHWDTWSAVQYRVSKTRLKLKSRDFSFTHNTHLRDTAVPCVKFQNNWSTKAWVMGKRNFARFGFKMRFGRISHIARSTSFSYNHWLLLHYVIVGGCVERNSLPGYCNGMLHISALHTASYCSPGCHNLPPYRCLTWISTVTVLQCAKRCLFQSKHENVKRCLWMSISKDCLCNTAGSDLWDLYLSRILLST